MLEFKHPPQAANHIRKILKAYQQINSSDVFPVDVKQVALELSKQWFPSEPIVDVKADSFGEKFNGLLTPSSPTYPRKWMILYNYSIKSEGRQNFTIAHELGHYLLHRHLSPPNGFKCSGRNMSEWEKNQINTIEPEANEFASYLLMPLDDLRHQIGKNTISPSLIEHLADRYMVSRLAILLKWVSMTEERAQLVVSEEGCFKWAKSSNPLFKSGIYHKKQEFKVIPQESAASSSFQHGQWITKKHGNDIWSEEEVIEMAFSSYDQEGSITISLLIFPKDAPPKENYDPDSIEVINPNQIGLDVEEKEPYISPKCRIFDDDESTIFDEQTLKW